jgi:hypothetical protein
MFSGPAGYLDFFGIIIDAGYNYLNIIIIIIIIFYLLLFSEIAPYPFGDSPPPRRRFITHHQ